MIPSGLTSSVINRARVGDGYIRVRDSELVTAVAQFLYDEAALLDEWRLDEWLALFHPEAAKYLIPSPRRRQPAAGVLARPRRRQARLLQQLPASRGAGLPGARG